MQSAPDSASDPIDRVRAGQRPEHPADPKHEEVAQVAASWYVPPAPPPKVGWLVFSPDFVLASLQGYVAEPHRARRTPLWRAIATIVRGIMAVAQAIIMVLSWLPIVSTFVEIIARTFPGNAPGFFLRACYWKTRLKHLGQDSLIDQYVDIRGPAFVSIGSESHLDAYVRLKAGERKYGQHGSIQIGNHVHLALGVLIVGRGGVEIQDFVGISANAHVYSATNVVGHPSDAGQLMSMSHMAPNNRQHVVEAPILIEEYAFIGMMARIMPGVTIGRGAVIHANAELTRDVEPFANIGGIPRGRQIGWRRPRRRSPKLADGNADVGQTNDPATNG